MAIRPETQQPPAAERTRFERIQLPGGQLSVVRPLPSDLPLDFVEELIKEEPWNKTGRVLKEGKRAELFEIAGVSIVKKQSRQTGREIQFRKEDLPDYMLDSAKYSAKLVVNTSTPSAQMAIIDEANRRWVETYGEDFPPREELLAFYIDRETTEKFTFLRHYEEVNPKEVGSRYQRMHEKAEARVLEIDRKLRAIGVDRFESGNYLIAKDPTNTDGFKTVLIDTEFWTIEG